MNAAAGAQTDSVPHTPDGGQPLLQVRDLYTQFDTSRGKVRAVEGVSFDVQRGEVVGIVGESGCGKSVTIRSILGLLPPPGKVASGSVKLDGKELVGLRNRDLRALRGASIGFVAQNPFGIFNPVLRIRKQFHIMMRTHDSKVTKDESYARASEMLAAVGIAGVDRVLNGYAHELSGGMAQRVGISMAMLLDPPLIIADEPTTALDVVVQRQILELIKGLVEKDQRSMLLVTHDLGVVAQYCQRVIVLYAGKTVEEGPVSEVFSKPAHPYTLGLLQGIPRPGKALISLKGRLPDLLNYPTGCPFKTRCQFVHDRCEVEEPKLRGADARTGRRACHLDAQEVFSRDSA